MTVKALLADPPGGNWYRRIWGYASEMGDCAAILH
jgi:hypothetical protein